MAFSNFINGRYCRNSNSAITAQAAQREPGDEVNMKNLGAKRWAIAEGYIPAYSHGEAPELTSHETVCILNAGDTDAEVSITIFYTDREPGGPYRLKIPARRTQHVRFNNLDDPEPIPKETDFASVIEANVPIVVQHTRLDSRQAETALLSTVAYAAGD
jgi:hypothetical protein